MNKPFCGSGNAWGGKMKRFKGQREKEAFVKRLLLSFEDSMEVEKPPFEVFVKRCEARMREEGRARTLAAKRWLSSLRWGFVLASVLLLIFVASFFFVGRSKSNDFLVRQTQRVEVEKGAVLSVSHYKKNQNDVLHFVVSEGDVLFKPEKLPETLYYVVETPHLYIRVVGTVFRVTVLSNETRVRVEEGRVWCYPRSLYGLDDVLEKGLAEALVLDAGKENAWSERENRVVSKIREEERKEVPQPLSSPAPRDIQGEKKARSSLLSLVGGEITYAEKNGYQVVLSSKSELTIFRVETSQRFVVNLKAWAGEWYPPVLLDNAIVVVAHNGTILRLSYAGKVEFKMRPREGQLLSSPVVTSRGVILSQREGIVVCLWTGESWTVPAERNFLEKSAPYYDEGRDILVFANERGSIAGYSLKKKDIVWTHLVKDLVGVPMVGRNGLAYIYGQTSSTVIAIDTSDGHFVWSAPLEVPVSRLEMVGERIFVEGRDNIGSLLVWFSAQRGERMGSFHLNGKISSFLVRNGEGYILTDSGDVYALREKSPVVQKIYEDVNATSLVWVKNRLAGVNSEGIVSFEGNR
jgi:outer membrane protein assembly factor BamB